jgi:hypothetical protein
MTKSRNRTIRKSEARSWSRREVISTAARVASALAVPQLWLPKAWGATTTFDYYISTSGNDANPGTLASPWALTSFQDTNPNNRLMAGKRVGLIAGNYSTAGITTTHTADADYTYSLLNIPAGTSGSSTYIASSDTSGNYSARAAIITVGGTPTLGIMGSGGGQMGGGTSSHITVDGIVINGNNLDWNLSALQMTGHLLQFWGTYNGTNTSNPASETGIVVTNCEIYGIKTTSHPGNNGALVWFEGCYNCIVQNNYLHDATSTFAADQDHVHAIEEYGCHGNQYIYNTITNSSSGIEAKLACTGTICAYNYFYNVGVGMAGASSVFEGFDGASGNSNSGPSPINYYLHHNVIDGCAALHMADLNTTFLAQPINVYNNTVYDTSAGATVGWQLFADAANLVSFYNNIYFTTQGTGGGGGHNGKLNVAANGNATLDYNCWYQAAGNYAAMWGINTTTYNSFAAWQAAIGSSYETHSRTANPAFSGSITSGKGAAQFQLGSGSPCLGTGSGGVNIGAWDGTVTQIGCSFALGSTTSGSPPVPVAPVLSVK